MSEKCQKLHEWFSRLNRHDFPFDEEEVPRSGIYILFEKDELAHGTRRIVRVGTHTGNNQLRSRLKQHFIKENKDRSIFRKNIGRALLNKNKDGFLEQWELDLTSKKAKVAYSALIDFDKQKEVEKSVTQLIQKNFSFVVFEVKDKDRRMKLESRIISTISLCRECRQSKNWLGLFSPKKKIRESGLWLVNELYKEPLSDKDMEEMRSLC